MDASIAVRPVFNRFQSVVITSGVRTSHLMITIDSILLLRWAPLSQGWCQKSSNVWARTSDRGLKWLENAYFVCHFAKIFSEKIWNFLWGGAKCFQQGAVPLALLWRHYYPCDDPETFFSRFYCMIHLLCIHHTLTDVQDYFCSKQQLWDSNFIGPFWLVGVKWCMVFCLICTVNVAQLLHWEINDPSHRKQTQTKRTCFFALLVQFVWSNFPHLDLHRENAAFEDKLRAWER